MDNLKLNFKKIYKELEKRYSSLKEPEKKKILMYVYGILTFFTVSFFAVFAINPTLNTITNLQKQYEDSKYVKESLVKKKNALRQLDIQFQTIKSDLNIVYLAIPTSPMMPYLTRQIQNLAQVNDLKIIRLDFGGTELYPATNKPSSIYSYNFNISLEGDEKKAIAFISSIINFDRIITLSTININKTSTGEVNLSITGRAYFNKQ
ncbi:hypothetical protein C4577_01415 [Candidatus Parcubacteria bacterium]|nr:MAG: hypothetical protein C4577_01415 [Candidatus Parcubacteria bacterium]